MHLRIGGLFCLANFMIAISSTCGMPYNLKILFTSSMKFLSSLYLSSASQFNVGYFILGLPSLHPALCVPSALARAMANITSLVASTTPCTVASFTFVCSLAIICICTHSAYVCLYETFTPDTM